MSTITYASRTRHGRQARTAMVLMTLFLIASAGTNWVGWTGASLWCFVLAVVAAAAGLVLAVRADREARKGWLE